MYKLKYDGDNLIGYEIEGENIKWSRYSEEGEVIKIKEGTTCIKGYSLSRVKIKSLYIPKTIKMIEHDAFSSSFISEIHVEDLSSFFSINFLTYDNQLDYFGLIHNQDFYLQDELLDSIDIPEGVEELKSGIMYTFEDLDTIILPKSLKTICKNAIPNTSPTIKYKGSMLDWNKVNIEELNLGIIHFLEETNELKFDSEIINKNAYKNLEINEIDLEGVREIKENAFSHSVIKSINWGSTLRVIGMSAFSSTKLNNIVIPRNVKRIEAYAFSYSTIENLKIPSSIETIEGSTFLKASIKNIEIEEGVKTIKKHAFHTVSNLKSIKLPNGLKNIEESAFYCINDLQLLIINNDIEEVGEKAFFGVKKLKEVVGSTLVLRELINSDEIGHITKSHMEEGSHGMHFEVFDEPHNREYAFDGCDIQRFYYYSPFNKELYAYLQETNMKNKVLFYSQDDPETNKGLYWHFSEEGTPISWNESINLI